LCSFIKSAIFSIQCTGKPGLKINLLTVWGDGVVYQSWWCREQVLFCVWNSVFQNDQINPSKFTFEDFLSFYRHLCARQDVEKIFHELYVFTLTSVTWLPGEIAYAFFLFFNIYLKICIYTLYSFIMVMVFSLNICILVFSNIFQLWLFSSETLIKYHKNI